MEGVILQYGIPVNEKWALDTAIERGLCTPDTIHSWGFKAMATVLDEVQNQSGIRGLFRSSIWITRREAMLMWVFPVKEWKPPRTREATETLNRYKVLAHVDIDLTAWHSTYGEIPKALWNVKQSHPELQKLRVMSSEYYTPDPDDDEYEYEDEDNLDFY